MSILEIIKNRRSIRKYQTKEIPSELVDQLIEALVWAPSAGNLQSRKFYFVFNEEIKTKLAEAALGQDFVAEAPLVVVGCTDDRIESKYSERGKKLYSVIDVSCSLTNLSLLAKELGLGTCWVGAFDEEGVREVLEIPDNLRPVAIMPVGYPDEKPLAPPRVNKHEAVIEIK